ncbi:MAG: ACT domain-containing protein [Peptococcaceae bacterium]|jgi:chorismate mutase|nr:ACT domain-containing protein [Peptococcaceae bacterium]
MSPRKAARSYIVREDILPEAILRTAKAKEMLTRGDALTVNEAVEKVGLSRSAFYKYRDGVLPYARDERDRIASFTLVLEHRAGILSNVLNSVAAMRGNIVSINQGMPVQGVAVATMSVNMTLVQEPGALLETLQTQEGVKRVEVLPQF